MAKKMKPKNADFFKPQEDTIFLPEACMIASPRAGTSSLFYNLRRHPSFYPHDLIKESHLFSWHWKSEEETLPRIRGTYKHPKGTFNIDGSIDHISHLKAAERIWHINPQQKFIAMFCDPVKRAYENFWMVVKGGDETVSTFEEAVELEPERMSGRLDPASFDQPSKSRNYQLYSYLERGKYVVYLKHWLQWFPLEQFLIIKSEDFFDDPQKVLDQVCDFINVSRYNFSPIEHWWDAIHTFGHENTWNIPQPINPDIEKRLYDFFRPYNVELSKLLGRNFNWGPEPETVSTNADFPPTDIVQHDVVELEEDKKEPALESVSTRGKTAKVILGGLLYGDAFHMIPFFNKLILEEGVNKIYWITGTFSETVAQFLTHFYPLEIIIKKDLTTPQDLNARKAFFNNYLDQFNAIEADLSFSDYDLTWENGFRYPKELLFLMNSSKLIDTPENALVVHPETRNIWKKVASMKHVDWSVFGRKIYTVGLPGEFYISNSVDLRGRPFLDVAKAMMNCKLVVCIHSSIACLSLYLQKPTLVCHPWQLPPKFGDFSPHMTDLIAPSKNDITNAVQACLEAVEASSV